jgi:hypothetical protein
MNDEKTLSELSKEFFLNRFDEFEPESIIRGRSGHKWKFDGIIKFNESKYGVFIREWNRSIGVNQVRQLQKACRDTDCVGGILVGSMFSPNAEMFAENLGIQLLDRIGLINKLKGYN